MKSFLRFLSNHKLYAAIEIVGLSLAMAFVILLSSMIIEESRCDAEFGNMDDVYMLYSEPHMPDMRINGLLAARPEIEEFCQFDRQQDWSFGEAGEFDIFNASENFFDFFTYRFAEGDPHTALSVSNAVVLSERLAAKLFPEGNAVGRQVTAKPSNGESRECVVTGVFKEPYRTVMPEMDAVFRLPESGYYEVTAKAIDRYGDRGSRVMKVKIGICPYSFVKTGRRADIGVLQQELSDAAVADKLSNNELSLIPFRSIHRGTGSEELIVFRNISDPALHNTFVFSCLALLLFAILNYISLTVAFSRFRAREMATRRLLGEQRSRIWVRSLSESGLLIVFSFILAVILALLLKNWIGSTFGTTVSPLGSTPDRLLALALVVVVTLVSGTVPSILLSRQKPVDVVRGESRMKDKLVLGKVFMVFQGALSIAVSAVSVSVFLQTRKMIDTPMGYETEGIVQIWINKSADFCFSEIASLPCVEKLGRSMDRIAGSAFNIHNFYFEEETLKVQDINIDREALDVLGIRLIETFNERASMQCLTESSVKKIEPLGKLEYDGVVSNFRTGLAKDLDESVLQFLYIMKLEVLEEAFHYGYARIAGDGRDAVREIRELLVSRGLPEDDFSVDLLEDIVAEGYASERKTLTVIGAFSILSLLLTALAILALSSYWVRMQARDSGIRKVFGCSRKKLFLDTVFGFLVPVMAGAVIAIPLAWWYVSRWLEQYPVRINNSIWIYLFSVAVVLLVVIASVSVQAVRLMDTNPAEVLKKE